MARRLARRVGRHGEGGGGEGGERGGRGAGRGTSWLRRARCGTWGSAWGLAGAGRDGLRRTAYVANVHWHNRAGRWPPVHKVGTLLMAAGVEGVASRAAPDGHSVEALHAQTSAAVGDRPRPTAAAAAEVQCGVPPAAARPQRARRAGGATASEGRGGRGAAGRRRRSCGRGECGRHARGACAAPPTAPRWQAGTASATGLLVGAVGGGGQGTGGSAAAQSPLPPPSSGKRLAPRGRVRPVPAAASVFCRVGTLHRSPVCVCVVFHVRGGACRTRLFKKE